MKAVLDAGPLIHLREVDALHALEVVDECFTTPEIERELDPKILDKVQARVEPLEGRSKDRARHISERHQIELGEATAISLAKQRDVKLVLTDDLEARKTADSLGLEPHGTLGIVTRAYSESILELGEAQEIVESLYKDSSLFLTKDLADWAHRQLKQNKE